MPRTRTRPHPPAPIVWDERLLLGAILLAGVWLRCFYPFSTTEWIDRDVQRAIGLVTGAHIPLIGPELNSGGFLPGPFFYVLLSSVYAFTRSPYAAVYLNAVLHLASIVFFLWILRRRYAAFPTLVALGWLCFSTQHAWSFGSPINPAFLFFFNTLMVWFFLKIFVDEQDWHLVPAMVTIGLGAQLHLSFAAHLLSLAVLSFAVHRPRVRIIGISLAAALLTVAPYLWYRHLTQDIPLYRSYQQFGASRTLYQIIPVEVFFKVFERAPLPVAEANLRELLGMLAPGWIPPPLTQLVRGYLWLSFRFQFAVFLLALAVGAITFLSWMARSKGRLSTEQRLLIMPFLATVPIVFTWQWAGISRHSHCWYSFVFFPLLPWWIGTTCELVVRWLTHPPWRSAARAALLLGVLALAPQTVMYHKTVFYYLDDVVEDLRDVKRELGLSLDRFRESVFFVDRPYRGHPKDMDPPFENPPWGSYTDYVYEAVGAGIPVRDDDDPGRCFLIGHRSAVEFYTVPRYLEQIDEHFGVRPTKVWFSGRLAYFAYPRPGHGTCAHNTTNAWVVNERMNDRVASVPAGRQSALIADAIEAGPATEAGTTAPAVVADGSAAGRSPRPGNGSRRVMEFAIADRTAVLPMTLRVVVERQGDAASWHATLESAHLMGHLNTMKGYAGLFRPWPKLWLDGVELVLEGSGVQQVLRFADGGDIGVFLLAPLTTKPMALGKGLTNKPARLLLRYRVHVTGRYEGGGQDIQDLAKQGAPQVWPVEHLLYAGQVL